MEFYLHYITNLFYDYPIIAPFAFVVLQVLMTIFFLPCSPLTLISGVLWGGVNGIIISIISSLLSLSITFFLSRKFFRNRITCIIDKRFPKFSSIISKFIIDDWRLIAIIQLSPIMPGSFFGYFFGLTPIKFKRYILFSLLFMLPIQFLYVLTGSSIVDLFHSEMNPAIPLFFISIFIAFFFLSAKIFNILLNFFGINNESSVG